MRHTLHFATLLALTSAATMHAQITNPDKLIAHPPRNPARQTAPPQADDLQWLWQYTSPEPEGNKRALLLDPRFLDLLQSNFNAPQSMWGIGTPLWDAAQQFLVGPGSVLSADNRHLTITGCITDPETKVCTQRGMLWIDFGTAGSSALRPLLLFAALRWTEQSKTPTEPHAPFNLWIFTAHELDPLHLPDALKSALAAWVSSTCSAPAIQTTLVVDPNGIPHIVGSLDAGISPSLCTSSTGPTS